MWCQSEAWNMYAELYAWREGSRERASECARRFVLLYSDMGRLAGQYAPGKLRWLFYPKFHLLLHCLEEATENVADSWCYPDEDAIGKAVDLASKCHIRTLSFSVLSRYRVSPLRAD